MTAKQSMADKVNKTSNVVVPQRLKRKNTVSMMDDAELASLSAQIQKETDLGVKELKQCNAKGAVEHFNSAYEMACKSHDVAVKQECAFNLGAAHIADHNPMKGINYLNRALPRKSTEASQINGDLYYNFGLAYELMNNNSKALSHLELALDEYQRINDHMMTAEVATRLGPMYLSASEYLQAARVYGIAATAYAVLSDGIHQASSLCQQATALLKGNRIRDAQCLADDCVLVCQNCEQTPALAKIYNDLGLIYTQCLDYNQAQGFFELALPLSRGPQGNMLQEAVILQNLGAACNFLGDYSRALGFHQQAANIYAKLHQRSAQGHCFLSLAYAYSRIEDMENARDYYLHALQAAKDSEDKKSQWQASEGLGAVYFHNHDFVHAVSYYQLALTTLEISGEDNPTAQERLARKLRETQQAKDPSPSQIRKPEQHALRPGQSDEVDFQSSHKQRSSRRHRHHDRSASATPTSANSITRPVSQEETHFNGKKNDRKRLSHRQSSRRKTGPRTQGQSYLNSLLKPEDHDSGEKHGKLQGSDGESVSSDTRDIEEKQFNFIQEQKRTSMMAAIPLPQNQSRSDVDSMEMEVRDHRGRQSTTDDSTMGSSQEQSTEEEANQEKQSDRDESSSSQNMNDTYANLKQYEQQLARETEENNLEPDLNSGSNVDTPTTLGAPDYTAPQPGTSHTPSHTYLRPVDDPSTSSAQDQTKALKVSVEDPDDPTYQKISSLIPTQTPELLNNIPPPTPELRQLSVAEEEAFLKQYHQQQIENSRDRKGRPGEDEAFLPKKYQQQKNVSKACVLM